MLRGYQRGTHSASLANRPGVCGPGVSVRRGRRQHPLGGRLADAMEGMAGFHRSRHLSPPFTCGRAHRLDARPELLQAACPPLAEGDIASAQDDYETREPGLGSRFVEQVCSTLTRIGNNPFQYQVINGTREHRRAPVQQFPFGIWYRVEPDESVVVACLAHRGDLSLARRRTVRPVEPP